MFDNLTFKELKFIEQNPVVALEFVISRVLCSNEFFLFPDHMSDIGAHLYGYGMPEL